MTLPETLTLNAWSGRPATGNVDPDYGSRILGRELVGQQGPLPAAPVDRANWRHPEVGWGVILPDDPSVPPEKRAGVADEDGVPAIARLVAERGNAPVLRAGPTTPRGFLKRYFPDGRVQDAGLASGQFGIGPGQVPRYLLIVGSPARIPWQVQYDLHFSRFVGRLDLDPEGLGHYVDALLSGWKYHAPEAANTLVWSVDNGDGITGLMERAVGKPLFGRFANDTDPALRAGARFFSGNQATRAGLTDAIANHRPSLIVTTSHGRTAPLDDTAAMAAGLGLPIDTDFTALDPTAIGGDSAPAGAIWFAQACCSAGSIAETAFEGILTAGSDADRILKAVAACGDLTAPLPKALLGSSAPLRAFVGHVEPTFDWSLRNPETKQFMSTSVLECFHRWLFTGHPIGLAMAQLRETAGQYLTSFDIARRALVERNDLAQLGPILALQLAARDWQSIVLLGDPTVSIYPTA